MKTINSVKDDSTILVEESLMTGKEDFDKWFSRDGGIVLGSAIYVSGTSGAGKTTLMTNLMTWLNQHVSAIYSREMLKQHLLKQVKHLVFNDNAHICDINDYDTFDLFMDEVRRMKPRVLIVDSLQVIAKEDYVMKDVCGEEKACYTIIKQLREYTSENDAVLFLIGHNTKDGDFAGANSIMQMMDAHIVMVHDKKTNTRTMSWGMKNRKGPSDGVLFYSINDSQIIFQKDGENVIKSSYGSLLSHLKEIVESNLYLQANPNQMSAVKKMLSAQVKKNEKISKGNIDFATKNIESYLQILLKLETGRI
jgi:predicted ATP-dependent serine protease